MHVTIMNGYESNIRKVKQTPKSMRETLHRLGIPWWLVKRFEKSTTLKQ